MKHQRSKTHGTLRIPAGAVRMGIAEKTQYCGGARRPNSIAWKAGKLLIGMNLFGVGGILFVL